VKHPIPGMIFSAWFFRAAEGFVRVIRHKPWRIIGHGLFFQTGIHPNSLLFFNPHHIRLHPHQLLGYTIISPVLIG
jgi:hypothetical protein